MNEQLLEDFIEETNLTREDYEEIIRYGYSEEDIEKIFTINYDYCIYRYNDYTELGEELFELYDYENKLPSHLQYYFDYEQYAKDFISNEEVIELSDECLVHIYGR